MQRGARWTVATLAMAALGVAACGPKDGAGGAAAPAVRIAIGGQMQLLYMPTTLAEQLGFYKEEGLDVTLQDFAGGAKALQALVGGSADVVSGFYDHTIQMAAEGRPMTAFVTMLRYPGLLLVASPASSKHVTRIEDLKGGVVGVTAPGSSTHFLVNYLLQTHGIKSDEVSVVGIGNAAAAVAAIEHGKVDAGMMADPAFSIVARRAPGVKVLADLRTADGVKAAFGTDMYPASVLYSKTEWVERHHDTARRLARAIVRTLAWIQRHSPEEIADKLPPAMRGEDRAVFLEALRHSLSMYSPDGLMAPEGAEAVKTLLSQSIDKVRDANVDLAKTYRNDLVVDRR